MSEARLVSFIADLKFGRIFNIEIPDEPKQEVRFLSPAALRLVEILREGNQILQEVIVHEGLPTYVEVKGTEPFEHIRRIKI